MSLSRAIAVAFAVSGAELLVAKEGDDAYQLDVRYTGEIWRNTHGGLRTGEAYLDNLDAQLTINGEQAWGISGLEVFGYLLYNNGGSASDLVGDAQVVSNIEALEQLRLYELWADWAFGAHSAHSLRVGLYDLNSEFDASEVASLFLNSAHGIGTQIGQTGENGPSIFPVTSLAARLRWQISESWNVQLAALDAVPGDPRHPSSNSIHLGGDEGALLVGEVSWHGERLRKLAAGAWTYTSRFDDVLATDGAGDPLRHRGNDGFYALVEANLWSSSADSSRSLDAYARYGTADARVNRFEEAWAVGCVASGLLPQRPSDQLGVAVAVASNGSPFREASALNGADTDRREYALELTYRAELTDWLVLQPTVQHIVNPDTDPTRADALAVALRFELAWSKSMRSLGR